MTEVKGARVDRGSVGRAFGLGFGEPVGPGLGGQERLHPPPEGRVALAGPVEVRGPVGRVEPVQGFAEDRHQIGGGFGHGTTWGSGFCSQCAVRAELRQRNRNYLGGYPLAGASASQVRAYPRPIGRAEQKAQSFGRLFPRQ
jgi:hypothetical protein